MMKKKRTIASLVITFMLAFIISSSVCLEFLTMTVLAAGTVSQSNEQPVMAELVFDHCSPLYEARKNLNVQPEYTLSRAIPVGASDDCCVSQDHHPSAANVDGLSVHFPIAAMLAPAVSDFKSESLEPHYQAKIFSPPEAEAISSIVKRE